MLSPRQQQLINRAIAHHQAQAAYHEHLGIHSQNVADVETQARLHLAECETATALAALLLHGTVYVPPTSYAALEPLEWHPVGAPPICSSCCKPEISCVLAHTAQHPTLPLIRVWLCQACGERQLDLGVLDRRPASSRVAA